MTELAAEAVAAADEAPAAHHPHAEACADVDHRKVVEPARGAEDLLGETERAFFLHDDRVEIEALCEVCGEARIVEKAQVGREHDPPLAGIEEPWHAHAHAEAGGGMILREALDLIGHPGE